MQSLHRFPPKVSKGEFGICDDCGEYTYKILFLENEWICEDCIHF